MRAVGADRRIAAELDPYLADLTEGRLHDQARPGAGGGEESVVLPPHQTHAAPGGELARAAPVAPAPGKRLLDQHVLSRLECSPSDRNVSREHRRHEYRLRLGRLQGCVKGREAAIRRYAGLRGRQREGLWVDVHASNVLHRFDAGDDAPGPVAAPGAHADLEESQRAPAGPSFGHRARLVTRRPANVSRFASPSA